MSIMALNHGAGINSSAVKNGTASLEALVKSVPLPCLSLNLGSRIFLEIFLLPQKQMPSVTSKLPRRLNSKILHGLLPDNLTNYIR
jgi:hypothetical protein